MGISWSCKSHADGCKDWSRFHGRRPSTPSNRDCNDNVCVIFYNHTSIEWDNSDRVNKHPSKLVVEIHARCNLGAVHTIDHELVPREMPYDAVQVHGLHFMVRVLKKLIYKPIGPLTRCKTECGPRRVTMHQKLKVLVFGKKLKFDHSLVFSWALLVFTSC